MSVTRASIYRVSSRVEQTVIARDRADAVKRIKRWYMTYGLRPKVVRVAKEER